MTMKRMLLRAKDLERIFNQTLWKNIETKEHSINGHPVVDIHLTEDMLITALTIGARIYQFDTEKGFRPIIGANYKQSIIGAEGVFAVASYIYDNWMRALDYIKIELGSDSGDLKLSELVIDVKTRTEKWHDILMVPKAQWLKHRYDFYIGCNVIAEDWIRIWGYISREDFEKKGEWVDYGHGPTLSLNLTELNDIIELKNIGTVE